MTLMAQNAPLGGLVGRVTQTAASLGLPLTFVAFGRQLEEQADILGLQYTYKAGYEPRGTVNFYEKLQAREPQTQKLSPIFMTHPLTADRVEQARSVIDQELPAQAQRVLTTREFEQIKARLAARTRSVQQ